MENGFDEGDGGEGDDLPLLDGLLRDWTERHRIKDALSARLRDGLRQAIRAEQSARPDSVGENGAPVGESLSYRWWRRVLQPVAPPPVGFWSGVSASLVPALGNVPRPFPEKQTALGV